jgi:molybdopterin molybdotransferase
MVGLLAAQGCIHPVCHRRVRLAVLAVGDHLVGPGEAPVMHRERNSAGLCVVAPSIQWGATAHDLGAVADRDFPAALARALTAHVVIVVGDPGAVIRRGCLRAGVEPVWEGVALDPCERLSYGIVRDGSGRASHHVVHIAAGPLGVVATVALLIGPLVARLQGGPSDPPPALRAVWSGSTHHATTAHARVVPVALHVDADARLRATPVAQDSDDDLLVLTRAEALALLPAGTDLWHGGEVVEVVPLGGWPAA